MTERDFDVVVFGASGITGRQVAGYLAERGARWAPAGRDAAKVERVLGEVGVQSPETIVADVTDPGSLAAMAARTRVVLNLCGPYTLHGRPVIEACVANGAHYMDLTGEIPFVRQMIDAYDARAQEAGVKIVEVAGFEALPPDLAVLLAAETARARWDEGLSDVDVAMRIDSPPGMPRLSEMLSGGTLQSVAAVTRSDDAAAVTDAAALVPDIARAAEVRRRSPINVAPRQRNGTVIAPMAPAAFINPAVIQRTAALAGAEPFRYQEGIALDGPPVTLPFRYMAAGVMAGTQAAVRATTSARPEARRRMGDMLERVLPSSGFGPTDTERMKAWGWRLTLDARSTHGHAVQVDAEANGHPGYLSTARMLGEAGLMLAEPGVTPERAGCLTPAIALGTESLDRFEHAQLRFSVSA